ncbi:MAG: ABC transporter substrate-binding protein [Candidatus Omnitrophota bacterium]|nr:ABC transporter substrate-binding protein [Candidatus Omnitrophota bacterium]
MKKGISYLLTLGLLAGLISLPAQAQEAAPQDAVAGFLTAIRSMEFPVSDTDRQKALITQANAYLDLEALSKSALADHWETATAEDRETFMGLLWSLIEVIAYPRSRDFLGDLEIRYPEIEPDSDGVMIHSIVVHEEEVLNAEVLYHVHEQDSKWVIDDIFLDGISITEDLRYQWDKIIQESAFSGLLDKMSERLAKTGENSGKKAL